MRSLLCSGRHLATDFRRAVPVPSRKARVAQNWPLSLLAYWQQTKTPDPDDYEML